ncbi:uncharacterized protein METZ01_LOCUS3108 [marine metagenome]|uniref:Uncharacterized protein n=1 Tax=marine metagenome TaxID=408172 RepID=A0A381N864_9ZZZZ
MLFSAYQIESLLEDIQQKNFPIDKSASETMSLSEDAIQGARQYVRTPKNHALAWITPGDIKALVEDQTVYDPVVEHVQQSRAGRFVIPAYVPENPPPSFPLVSDHTKALRENDALQEQTPEMPLPEKNTSSTDESLEIPSAADVEALTDVEELVQDSADDTEISTLKPIPAEESSEESAEELAVESTDEQTQAETEESTKSKSAKSGISAASLFDEIEVEEEQDEEFDFDTGGLQGAIDDDSDVVFGDGRIEQNSMTKFVSNYPDSTIKFLLRKSLDGRPLPAGYDEIYLNWENRGLSRGRLKKYLFKLMEWQDFPDIPVLDVVRKIRERHFELRAKNK